MRHKVPVPPCQHCGKLFRRSEHLARHERTHTKEKPFACRLCSKSFARKDLLLRHHRLSHGDVDDSVPPSPHSRWGDTRTGNVDNRSSAVDAVAQVQEHTAPAILCSGHNGQHYSLHNPPGGVTLPVPNAFPSVDVDASELRQLNTLPLDPFDQGFLSDDLDHLWNTFDCNMDPAWTSSYAPDLGASLYGFTEDLSAPFPGESSGQGHALEPSSSTQAAPRLSHGASLTSGANSAQSSRAADARLNIPPKIRSTRHCPWRLTQEQYGCITAKMETLSAWLPMGFRLPSRFAMSRYAEGYFAGFHEHLPFLHVSTMSLDTVLPELVLAIITVGSLYRFEHEQSGRLYVATRNLLLHRIEDLDRNDRQEMSPRLDSDANRRHTPHDHTNPREGQTNWSETPIPASASGLEGNDGPPLLRKTNHEVIPILQAMILLIAMGTWNERTLLKDAFAMSSQLALILHETVINSTAQIPETNDWHTWLAAESVRRTELVAYCFLNLHSVTYNTTPVIKNQDLIIHLPSHESLWSAKNAEEWRSILCRTSQRQTSFREALSFLFSKPYAPPEGQSYSAFANFVLIHAILQQIFFARHASTDFGDEAIDFLPQDRIQNFESVLHRWQQNWEMSDDPSKDIPSPARTLAFNATALLRIAYIRLHVNLGPSRLLGTRDPLRIAQAMDLIPAMGHTSQVHHAVVQSAQTLCIPVRMGIRFVAKTRTLTWSVVHALCNLECAIFLSQWLNCIARKVAQGGVCDAQERRLLSIVQGILDEAFVGEEVRDEVTPAKRYIRMASAVVRLWAETFRGMHIFSLMGVIGQAFDIYANILDSRLA